MHWIIQENLHREAAFQTLIETMERHAIPYDLVKVVPFSDELPPDEQTIPPVDPEGLVMVCGSTSLAKIAGRRGWTPGSFLNAMHDYREWARHYGRHLLNADAKVCRLAEVSDDWQEFFIRPCEDSKAFNGSVMSWAEFDEWRRRVIDLKETYTTLSDETMVTYSPCKVIYKEFRFFVVDGEIVGQSIYKVGSRVLYDSCVDDEAVAFAREMVDLWRPARAFVIDVAMTDEGYRVIEINCINSAGFYAIDVARFVMAIEAMEFPGACGDGVGKTRRTP